ncbi:transcription repressor NadR [Aquibacillus sp. 3ASR75-11]|uniref:Transcription repressor NadR n=1 Tax=Terrihalobacillus insolitus TaxID=2950438 RepID=A0A9X3WNT9_9BACI|nr:transcription repressor NadR [Terrihalobacillus insolitus]MDC3411889.1 transcription repressor NadR [Terrihalobacillus insolitus]MDC3423432.1 transcription repressor NadR [Terrihalobacillus insolitus]
MGEEAKILGKERRSFILNLLKNSTDPITGGELATKANVSRQVIVGDISLLKAKNEPILATSQGYMYMASSNESKQIERTIACQHTPEQTEQELLLIVDQGATVKSVTVEHPVYGEFTASIMVSNRRDVKQFLEKVKASNASLLSELTDGIHLHTISAENEAALNEAIEALREAGITLE